MLEKGKQVFTVTVRYNPQLGNYLMDGGLATIVSVGRGTFRVKAKSLDGSMKTSTYCICGGQHILRERNESAYGSASRFAFDCREKALQFLNKKRVEYAGYESRQKTCDAYIDLVNEGLA